jgi:hypothetical protein
MSAPASTAFAETRSKEEFTITEIAKTAEQLLRTATDSPFTSRTQANTHPKATMAPLSSQNQGMKTRVVLPFGGNNSSDEPSREGITSTSDLGASSSPPFVQAAIAAEEVAALVNEILIEQARRHGVDLS